MARKVALFFQRTAMPAVDGLVKPPKPGGYRDSCADLAFALRGAAVTPVDAPDPCVDADWSFPDTREGIEAALARGADTLWMNTVLFEGHPVQQFPGARVVGQQPPAVAAAADDKARTNARLAAAGLDVARSELVASAAAAREAFCGPAAVVKPVRGRGSAGVTVVRSAAEAGAAAQQLLDTGDFGEMLMVEPFLGGQEYTVAVLPPGDYPAPVGRRDAHWALPPVLRGQHVDGVLPYNGDVPVTANSRAVREPTSPFMAAAVAQCERAAELIGAVAPIRIDVREDAAGVGVLFDLNAKPNATGAGRPGRDDQNSLVMMAAAALGWSFPTLAGAVAGGEGFVVGP